MLLIMLCGFPFSPFLSFSRPSRISLFFPLSPYCFFSPVCFSFFNPVVVACALQARAKAHQFREETFSYDARDVMLYALGGTSFITLVRKNVMILVFLCSSGC